MMHHDDFICNVYGKHLGHFWFLLVLKNATVKGHVKVFVWTYVKAQEWNW